MNRNMARRILHFVVLLILAPIIGIGYLLSLLGNALSVIGTSMTGACGKLMTMIGGKADGRMGSLSGNLKKVQISRVK